jgi:hypothetical protein
MRAREAQEAQPTSYTLTRRKVWGGGSAKRESQPHNSSPTLHQPINVVRYRHPMGSVALPDCSAEAVSERSQGHAQQVASYLCEWVATTGFEPGTDGWVVANSRSAKKD